MLEERFNVEDKEAAIALRNSAKQWQSLNQEILEYKFNWKNSEWLIHKTEKENDPKKNKLYSLKDEIIKQKAEKIEEIEIKANSLLELHRLDFISEQEFNTEFRKIADMIEFWNNDFNYTKLDLPNKDIKEETKEKHDLRQIKEELKEVFDDDFPQKDMENNTEIDDVIKNLQSHLLATKAENILSLQKLSKEIDFNAIREQDEYLKNQRKFVTSVVLPVNNINDVLCEKLVRMEKEYGFRKKKGSYNHKQNWKNRRAKKAVPDDGVEEICGDPNTYLKDCPYMSDKSDDFDFEDIKKAKQALAEYQNMLKNRSETEKQPSNFHKNLEMNRGVIATNLSNNKRSINNGDEEIKQEDEIIDLSKDDKPEPEKSNIQDNENKELKELNKPDLQELEKADFEELDKPNFGDNDNPDFGEKEKPNFQDMEKQEFQGLEKTEFQQLDNEDYGDIEKDQLFGIDMAIKKEEINEEKQ